jgi:trimethylamine--corrinoid protein Co-methyltransferase
MQWYEFLTQHQVEQVHEASMQILAKVGIDFRYPPALAVLKKGGARIDGERVFLPERLVEEQVKKAPAEFTLYARNSDFDVVIGGNHMAFVPGYGAAFVTDLDIGRREGSLKDFENFVKLTDASPYQDICSGVVIEPTHRNEIFHQALHGKCHGFAGRQG